MKDGDMGPFAGMDPALEQAITRYGTKPYRQIVTVSVRHISDSSFDELPTTIDGWIKWLNEAREDTPAEHRDGLTCVLDYEPGWYGESAHASLVVSYERAETDEEMTVRVERGIAYVRSAAAKERATYEALKRKYEGG